MQNINFGNRSLPSKLLLGKTPVVSEEMFKECGRRTDGQAMETYLSYKLTNVPSAQVSSNNPSATRLHMDCKNGGKSCSCDLLSIKQFE